jgi:predicted nucleic acid-binding protein
VTTKVPNLYFDSCCFIDMVRASVLDISAEGRDKEVWFYRNLLEASKNNEVNVYTSYLTVAECWCIKDDKDAVFLTDEVRRLFDSILLSGRAGVTTVLPTKIIIDYARNLRWERAIALRPYDSLHVATAIEMECSEFITTDVKTFNKGENISRLLSLGLRVISGSDTRYLPAHYLQEHLSFGKV